MHVRNKANIFCLYRDSHTRHAWWANELDDKSVTLNHKDSKWHHVAIVFDGKQRRIVWDFYETCKDTPDLKDRNVDRKDTFSIAPNFHGQIKVIRIFNKGLELDDIKK